MTADPVHKDEVELARRARSVKAISSMILMTLGGIVAIAQLITLIQSGALNLIISAISFLVSIIGIASLFSVKRHWSALMGAAVMLAIVVCAIVAILFVKAPEGGSFASPHNGQHVNGRNLFAAGSIEGVTSTLLCIVKDESGNYVPNDTQSANGHWSAVVGIGPQNINRPLPFTLILATATQSAVDEIRIRREGDPAYNTHGLGPNLPLGIEIRAKVGIVRTS